MARLDVSSGETSVGSLCRFRARSMRVARKLGAIPCCVNFIDNGDFINQFGEYSRLYLWLFEFWPET